MKDYFSMSEVQNSALLERSKRDESRYLSLELTRNTKVEGELDYDYAYRSLYARKTNASKNNGTVLALSDVASIALSLFISYYIADFLRALIIPSDSLLPITNNSTTLAVVLFVPMLMIPIICSAWGHYSRFKSLWLESKGVIKACIYTMCATVFILFYLKEQFSRAWFLTQWVFMPINILFIRMIAKKVLIRLNIWFRPTVVIGDGRNAEMVTHVINTDYAIGQKVICYIALADSVVTVKEDVFDNNHLLSVYKSNGVDILKSLAHCNFIFAPDTFDELLKFKEMLDYAATEKLNLKIVPPMDGLPIYGAEFLPLFKYDAGILQLSNKLLNKWSILFKRLFDIFVASITVLLFSPILLLTYIVIRLDGGSAIYHSARIGLNGHIFNCYKFRSMVPNADEKLNDYLDIHPDLKKEWFTNFKLENDPRVTKIGKLIRKYSIDELPQLFNVIKGDMSLVGPRPILPEEKNLYGSKFVYYAKVKPGITGLWQVSGRSTVEHRERVRLNIWYIRNWSLWIDIVILFKTIPVVIKGSAAY